MSIEVTLGGVKVLEVEKMDVESRVYSVPEIIRMLRISRNSCYEAIRNGRIFGVRIGRRWLIPKAGIEKLLTQPEPSGEKRGRGLG